MEDDTTPPDRLGPADALRRTLLSMLTNHVIVLTSSAKAVGDVRDTLALQVGVPASPELAKLAAAFRAEGDSAHAVAKAAEDAVRANNGAAKR